MKFVTLTLITFYSIASFSQEGTFKAYVNAGIITSQIEGDSVGGFNKWGFTGGVGTYFMFAKKFSANLELNYAQRGSSGIVYNQTNDPLYHRQIFTDYIEAPLMVQYHDKEIAQFGAGIIVSSLINTTLKYNYIPLDNKDPRQNDVYKTVDLSMVLSATFNIKRHYGLNLRFIHSIIPFTKNNNYGEDQYHSALSVRGFYYF